MTLFIDTQANEGNFVRVSVANSCNANTCLGSGGAPGLASNNLVLQPGRYVIAVDMAPAASNDFVVSFH